METMRQTAGDLLAREFLGTTTDPSANATRDMSAALTSLLADVSAFYIKTKNSTGT